MVPDELVRATAAVVNALPLDQVELLAVRLERDPSEVLSSAAGEVPTFVFRRVTTRLISTARAAGVAGPALALALRAAAMVAGEARAQQRVGIVWTGPTSTEVPVRLTREVLIDVIRSARRRLLVLSFAGHRVPVIEAELRAAAGRGVDVRLILESERLDAALAFASLSTDVTFWVWPASRRPILAAGHASLHAKGAIADEHTAFVTSANLTGHGMEENIELGLLVEGGPVPASLAAHVMALMETGVLAQA